MTLMRDSTLLAARRYFLSDCHRGGFFTNKIYLYAPRLTTFRQLSAKTSLDVIYASPKYRHHGVLAEMLA